MPYTNRGISSKVVLDVRVVTGTGGGPDKTILNSPRYLSASGYRMVCAYLHPPGDPGFEVLTRKAAERDAPLVSIPDRGPLDWRVVSHLLQVCRTQRVNIWHGHDYKSNALGLVLARLWPSRLVTTLHGWVERTRRTPLYYAVDRLCLRHYERVYCVSPDLNSMARRSGVPAGRCELLENCIDLAEYRRHREVAAAKAQLGLPPNRYLIGAAGRLSAEKGFDVLIHAVALLCRRGRDVGLVILGQGGEHDSLQSQINELGLKNRVSLAGFQAETIPWYEAMDAFAVSSYREGLPNVLLEAMALEVPVVATRVAGIPRLIDDQVNGLLVPPGSTEGLAEALGRLMDSPADSKRLSESGRRTVEQRYSFARRMERLAASYDQLLETKRSRP